MRSYQIGRIDRPARGSDILFVAGFRISKNEGRSPVRALVRLPRGGQVLVALVAELVERLRIRVDDGSGSVSALVWFSRWSQELVPGVVFVVDCLGFREDQLCSPVQSIFKSC